MKHLIQNFPIKTRTGTVEVSDRYGIQSNNFSFFFFFLESMYKCQIWSGCDFVVIIAIINNSYYE